MLHSCGTDYGVVTVVLGLSLVDPVPGIGSQR